MSDVRKTVSFDSMNLQVGGRIQLLVVRDVKPIPYFSMLIGYVRNEYLILKTPTDDKAMVSLREGEKMMVRVFSGVSVCTFNASLLRVFGAPFFYIHVSFPDEIIGTSLRSAMRVKVDIPALVNNPRDKALSNVPVMLSNLSVTGTQIESPIEVGQPGETLGLSFQGEDQPSGVDMAISAQAVIKNVGIRDAGTADTPPLHLYGVQFLELEPAHRILLQNMTYQALMSGRQNIV